jgi:nicotinate-nucleotide adenylyltransferase
VIGLSKISPQADAARRIGLMGGSFDPVHSAHVALATSALSHLQLDEVRWIPVGQAWQKARRLAPASDRIAMVQGAIAHEPRFVLDPIEVNRDGPSFTLDTVRALQAVRPEVSEWVLIIGVDQYLNLPSWQGWQALLARVTLAVATREPFEPEPPEALRLHPHRMVHLPMAPQAVSSTEVRERLLGGESPESLAPELIPIGVARYIANHQIYASGAPR